MDELEQDYPRLLLAEHEPPCLSLYQPTHRHHPDREQDRIRFRNLTKALETSLLQRYPNRETEPLLARFRALADDTKFWNHTLDGLAVLATSDLFKVYRLQRPVPELAIVANSFHTKPLLRILQSADRYQILGLSRQSVRLFEGNRDAIDEVALAPEVPRSPEEAAGEVSNDPERKTRVYGRAVGTTRHGTDVREAKLAGDTERFFRAVDRAVLAHHSRPTGLPLFLMALPEQHHLFRRVTSNPFLADEAISNQPDSLSIDELRERAWRIIEPYYLRRLSSLIERFGAGKSKALASDDLDEIAIAAASHRIAVLMIDADRVIPGTFDTSTGTITPKELVDPHVDDVLDDLGEQTLRTGGEVVIVPTERMPTRTGIAAIYRGA